MVDNADVIKLRSSGKGHKTSLSWKKRPGELSLEDVEISIDLSAEVIHPGQRILDKLFDRIGLEKIEKDYDLIITTDNILKSFEKAGYSNILFIEVDDKRIYEEPDEDDIDKALNEIIDWIPLWSKTPSKVLFDIVSNEDGKGKATVTITRYHYPWNHDVSILFKYIPQRTLKDFIGYLQDHLNIESIDSDWTDLDAPKGFVGP